MFLFHLQNGEKLSDLLPYRRLQLPESMVADYINDVYWKVGLYTIASLVGTARIYHDKHWFSDVIMGSAIGYFIGDYVSQYPENKTEQEGKQLPDYSFNVSFPLNSYINKD